MENVKAIVVKADINDDLIIDDILSGQKDRFEALMRKYNQQLYRISRAYGIPDFDCDDIMQQAYINAFRNLSSFRRESRFSTWLIKILINECLLYKRRNKKTEGDLQFIPFNISDENSSPEKELIRSEMKTILEQAIGTLPEKNRIVFVMREIEELSGKETAEALGISEANVRVIHHRSKEMLKNYLKEKIGTDIYTFGNERCNQLVSKVLSKI